MAMAVASAMVSLVAPPGSGHQLAHAFLAGAMIALAGGTALLVLLVVLLVLAREARRRELRSHRLARGVLHGGARGIAADATPGIRTEG